MNAQIDRAQRVADRSEPLKKQRFVKITGQTVALNEASIERARQAAGYKGYVTNIDPPVMDGHAVVAAYHDLWKVEQSFRMAKSDLKARPIFHRTRDSIEAHLTIDVDGHELTARTPLDDHTQAILTAIAAGH